MKKLFSRPPGKRRTSSAVDDLLNFARQDTDRELDELGKAVYGDKWPQVLAHNTKRLAGDDGKLSLLQKGQLIKGLKVLRSKR